MDANEVAIRSCVSHDDLKACVHLQRRIWNFGDEDIVPGALFVVAQHTGGHAYCAFHDERAIGFALAFSAERDCRRFWHSHMVGVLPEYQNQGVGRLLKLRQRDEALRVGIETIEWTFDPLELRNAHFNIVGLGAIARHYIRDFYGETTSPLHGNLPTDRLVIEWPLRSRRVEAAVTRASTPHRDAVDARRVAVPAAIREWRQREPERARVIQSALRQQFTDLFLDGYGITGFLRGNEQCEYVLEPNED